MHYIPYNSRKGYHKNPFGAVSAGSSVLFRIVLPRDFHVSAVWLTVSNTASGKSECLSLVWECLQGDGEEWWSVHFSPAEPGLFMYHFEYGTPAGRSCICHAGNGLGKISETGEDWQLTVYCPDFNTPDWLKGGVIYQIFPDRFFSYSTEKTGIPDDRILRSDWGGEPMWAPDAKGNINRYDFFGGDLKGITQKLSYLAALHVTCIYLNPIFEAHSNHRYDTADYMKLDPLLGTEKDFNELCSLALENGIRIVLDGVFSHTGADSLYFNKNRRYPLQGAYNSQQSPYYRWYSFRCWPDDYKSWWGINILPEINENDPDFTAFINGENGVARKWLKAGASGWRLDVADELPDGFLDEFRKAVKSENPDAYILGEVWEDASNKCSYGSRRRYLNGIQLDSVMNYPIADALFEFVRSSCAERFMETQMNLLENYPPQVINTLMNHIGTHDTMRALTRFSYEENNPKNINTRAVAALTRKQRKKSLLLMKLISAVQFTLPGVPSIFYGDEAGMEGGRDPFNRGCYPWGSEDKNLLSHFKLLGNIRKDCPALIDGTFEPVSAENSCLAFSRTGRGNAVLTVANRSETDIVFRLNKKWSHSKVLLGNETIAGGNIKVAACSAVILSV